MKKVQIEFPIRKSVFVAFGRMSCKLAIEEEGARRHAKLLGAGAIHWTLVGGARVFGAPEEGVRCSSRTAYRVYLAAGCFSHGAKLCAIKSRGRRFTQET